MKNYFTNIISCHFSRLANGMLSANDPALIEWGSPVGIGWNSVNDINYPALATAGTEVVVTFEEGMSALKYALGKILLQYENGTLVKGSSDKVYVMLNDYRYWIPSFPRRFAHQRSPKAASFSRKVSRVIPSQRAA